MSIVNLEENETTVYETKGDWWAETLLGKGQTPGVFEVTSKRFAFRTNTLFGKKQENAWELNVGDIASVEKCNIGNGVLKIIPTGLRVAMQDGTKYIVSVMKRDQLLAALEQVRQ